MNDAAYVLPLRRAGGAPPRELSNYLGWLAESLDVVVVDGSPPETFSSHAVAWAGLGLRHVRPDPDVNVMNSKVAGVLTGLRLVRGDRVIIADDDVRYDDVALRRVIGLLDHAELVRPQNFFDPCPWHARWDSACYVRRLPCTARHFWSQRMRQAYDDIAQPPRLAVALSVVPVTVRWALRRQWLRLAVAAGTAALTAETGRRRAGGQHVFPPSASLFAPVWLAERGLCSWVAVAHRLLRGGCPYHGTVIRRAASPTRRLRGNPPHLARCFFETASGRGGHAACPSMKSGNI